MAEDLPKPPLTGEITHNARGKFVKGNTASRGRPKVARNKTTLTTIEMLRLAAAKKGSDGAGLGGEQGFLDAICERNPELIASHLIRATVPPAKEAPVEVGAGYSTSIIVRAIDCGQQFAPGGEVLLPFEEAGLAHKAFNAGVETWKAYLVQIEGQLTLASFQKLSGLEAPEPRPVPNASNVVQAAAPPRQRSLH